MNYREMAIEKVLNMTINEILNHESWKIETSHNDFSNLSLGQIIENAFWKIVDVEVFSLELKEVRKNNSKNHTNND